MADKTQETIDLFNHYKSAKLNWNNEASNDIQFVNNAQWEIEIAQALEADNQPVVVNNEMKPARDQVVQQLTDNDPRWMALPRENSDSKVAGAVSDLGSYIWDASSTNMHFRRATEDFVDTGYFILHTYYDPNGDYGKGEIKICRINPLKFYPDPSSTWRNLDDGSEHFLSDIFTEKRIKFMYPNFNLADAVEESENIFQEKNRDQEGQSFTPIFLPDQKYYRVIDRYQKIKVERNWVYDPSSNFEKILDDKQLERFLRQPAVVVVKMGEQQVITDEDEVTKTLQIMQRYGEVFHYMSDNTIMSGVEGNGYVNEGGQMVYPIPNTTVRVFPVTMQGLHDEGRIQVKKVPVDRIKRTLLIGEKFYKEWTMPITKFPFGVTQLHNTDTSLPYGDARITRPIQEQINKIYSIIISYNINITNLKVFVDETTDEKDLEDRWGKTGAQFFKMDMENGKVPYVIQHQAMNSALYNQLDRLKFLIQRMYGVYEYQDGGASTFPQTKGGAQLQDESGYRRSRSKLKLIEEALNYLGAVISEMIPYAYPKRKAIRILGQNNKLKETVFNDIQVDESGKLKVIKDLTINRYDLKIVSGSTMPTNMQQRFEQKIRLWELGLMRDPEPILRESGLEDVEEIMQNESKLNEAQQIAQQMDETIKELKGDMQTLQRENVHAEQKVVIEKFKTKLVTITSRLEASQLLTQYRQQDELKMNKQIKKEAKASKTKN